MHLLSAQSFDIAQEGEALDLEQTPADLIFLTAADSEIGLMASAAELADENSLRCANLMQLSHNMSVDMWIDKTARFAKTILVRLLGGEAYWRYGVERLVQTAEQNQINLVFFPGDGNADPRLRALSSIQGETYNRLHSYFIAGGPSNFRLALNAMRDFGRYAGFETSSLDAPVEAPQFALLGEHRDMLTSPEHVSAFKKTSVARALPIVPLICYRAFWEGDGNAIFEALIEAGERSGLTMAPIIVSSLKSVDCAQFVQEALKELNPPVILNMTGFALGVGSLPEKDNPFAHTDAPIIQLVQSSRPKAQWESDSQGLLPRDLAMQVVLPELDGRIGTLLCGHKENEIWNARVQCRLTRYAPDVAGIAHAIQLAKNWIRLRNCDAKNRKIGMVLANYPIRDGRLANGVGYDAPQSTVEILQYLQDADFDVRDIPENGNALIEAFQQGPTNQFPDRGRGGAALSLDTYQELLKHLPSDLVDQVMARWGEAQEDPFVRAGQFELPVLLFGNVAILLQPARGYHLDETANFHDPDLVPPHAYLAAYLWLRYVWSAHALIHNGKHGNLEWLPGKAVAQGAESFPLNLWGDLPHLYPFIVNDPGEGTQAKRRTGAVILDHLVPPLTRAQTYGPLKDLEALLDEYYQSIGMDHARLSSLKKRILDFARDHTISDDLEIADDDQEALSEIDNYLCELKEAQIRDGLHIFGQAPKGDQRRDLAIAIARVPRGEDIADQSIMRILADELALGIDPLDVVLGAPWTGPKPDILAEISDGHWRNHGDTIERMETLIANMLDGAAHDDDLPQTHQAIKNMRRQIIPLLDQSGQNEKKSLLAGLAGKFIEPGASGAPSRGRMDVLPTGRNFYAIDNRATPTPTAWELGQKSAELLVLRHFQEQGTWLHTAFVSAWGTANMRTGGDDIAQAMALIGVKPKWDPGSLRVNGFEIIPLAKLGRPRVDVTLKISGFFRDAFPQMIALFDRACRAVGALDEPADQNPIAAHMHAETIELQQQGQTLEDAGMAAGFRVFGSKPGAYGAGLQGLIDNDLWQNSEDLTSAFVNWGQYAYGAKVSGSAEQDRFRARLSATEAVIQNQDNREHDLLDSDDYYQFEGGLVAAAQNLSGRKPVAYHNDHARPEFPKIKTLEEEIAKVVRSRVVNPKWISGVKRHGYKGAFEIVATVDYMFAFAATAGAVKSHQFDLAFDAFIADENTSKFLKDNNAHGYAELVDRFKKALDRGFWQPKSNSAIASLEEANHE